METERSDGRTVIVHTLQDGQIHEYVTDDLEIIEVVSGGLHINGPVFLSGHKTDQMKIGQRILVRVSAGPATYRRLIGDDRKVVKNETAVVVPSTSPEPDDPAQQALLRTFRSARGGRGTVILKAGGDRLYRVIKSVCFSGRWLVLVSNGETDSAIELADIQAFEPQ